MKKNNNKTNVLNTNTGVQHVQIAGVAYYDESKYFMFAPNRCPTAPSTLWHSQRKSLFRS